MNFFFVIFLLLKLLTKLSAIPTNAIAYDLATSANVPKASDRLLITGSSVLFTSFIVSFITSSTFKYSSSLIFMVLLSASQISSVI